ncbi:MAG: Na(+)/H(+) antiporter subunit D [bacterium]
MNNLWIHPSLVLIGGALLLPFIPRVVRKTFLLAVPLLTFAVVLLMLGAPHAAHGVLPFLDWTLTFGRVDALCLVFAVIMSGMCVIGTLFSLHVEEDAQHIAAWVYVSGSLGAIFAGDLIVLFLFWELMAFSSVFLIWFRRRPQATAAGFRYLLVHVAGGLTLLAGLVLHMQGTGSIAFNAFNVQHPSPAEYLILIGILLNAAVPPLHAWLPDAYPEGTFNGSVFLSAFTTKTAVYALCRGFAGMELLVWLGVVMSLYGVVFAIIENDIRRLFAYHIVSQVGYMVAGVGIGTALAINGACAHAFAHILYKGLLFMGGGTVLYMTGETRMSHLGGLYRKMPWTFLLTLIGGLSISAFPFFSGFVSKSMIVTAAFEHHWIPVGFLLTLASIGTLYCNGLKVPYFVWFGRDHCAPDVRSRAGDPPWNMFAAMSVAALLCIFLGCYTPALYNLLPHQAAAQAYQPYNAGHISESLQVLFFTALVFFLLVRFRKIDPHAGVSLDLDWFYRMGGRAVLWVARKPAQAADEWVSEFYRFCGLAWMMATARASAWFDGRAIDGVVDGLANNVRTLGDRVRHLQTKSMQFNIFSALVVIVAVLLGYALVVMTLR